MNAGDEDDDDRTDAPVDESGSSWAVGGAREVVNVSEWDGADCCM